MSAAIRMRKYRARLSLRKAVERAVAQGLDAGGILREHLQLLESRRALRSAMKGEDEGFVHDEIEAASS